MRRFGRWGWALAIVTAGAVALAGCSGLTRGAAALAPSTALVAAGQDQDGGDLRTVTVSGVGQASAAPDVAYLTLGVESRDVDASAAIRDNTQRMQAVMAALEGLGLTQQDVQTVTYSMWLEQASEPTPTARPLPDVAPSTYSEESTEASAERFHVVNQVRVTVRDLDTTGNVLAAALEAGANSVDGISFGVEDTTALLEQARDDAIGDAKARAEQLATGFGATLGRLHSVSEYGSSVPVRAVAADQSVLGGGSVPVSAGELTYSVEIQVTFELAQ